MKRMGAFYWSFFYYFYRLTVVVLYLPSAYAIEVYGLNPAISFSMLMTTVGLWLAFINVPTLGGVFVGIGTPFVLNTTTKVSSLWYGPKGRNIATMVMLLGYYASQSIEEFYGDDDLSKGVFPLCLTCTSILPLCYLLIYNKPDFSPTMSEEEKLVLILKNPKFDFMTQVRIMLSNRLFLLTTFASVCLLIAND